MTNAHRLHRLAAAGLAGVTAASLLVAGPAGAAPTGPEPAFAPTEYVVDGVVVAVRRAPAPAGAYGAHGVDYAPSTAP